MAAQNALSNPLTAAQLQPALAAALQAQVQQHLAVSQANAVVQHQQQQQQTPIFDYATLAAAAAAAQNNAAAAAAYGIHPNGKHSSFFKKNIRIYKTLNISDLY